MRISDWSSDVCSSDLSRPWKLRAKNLIERWRRKMNKPVKAQLGVLSRLIASQPKAPNPTGDSRVLTPENPETKPRSEEHTSELQSLMRISYAVFCLKKKKKSYNKQTKLKTLTTLY